MRETGSEVCTIYIELLLSGQVNVDAARAVDFYTRSGKLFGNTDGQDMLPFAEDSRASSKSPLKEFLSHFIKSVGRKNEASMYHTV